jgi:serine/threonine-protein kinase RsbW
MRIHAGPTAAAEARAAVSSCFDGVLPADKLDDVLLVVSELVTNSVLHGHGEIDMRVSSDGKILSGSVTDEGRGFDWRESPRDPRRIGGNGLYIVGRVSEQWGLGDGPTSVWFEIRVAN